MYGIRISVLLYSETCQFIQLFYTFVDILNDIFFVNDTSLVILLALWYHPARIAMSVGDKQSTRGIYTCDIHVAVY
jgi:hypothetical protein